MNRLLMIVTTAVFVLWVASAVAQSPGTGTIKMNPVAASSGSGVSNASLLDRPEVRVLRGGQDQMLTVELQQQQQQQR